MLESEPQSRARAVPRAPLVTPFGGDIDETLVDALLAQSISDRLRSLCRYANALARFRPV